MAGVGPLYDENRASMLKQMRAIRHIGGAAYAGVVVEAALSALAEYIREGEGAEAAFNAFTRHADEVIAPVVESRAARPGSQENRK